VEIIVSDDCDDCDESVMSRLLLVMIYGVGMTKSIDGSSIIE
jgi:hypothetical protein